MADDIWLYVAVAFGLIIIAMVVLLLMEQEKKKPLSEEKAGPAPSEFLSRWPLTVSRTVANGSVKEAMDKLRILDLEREILSYAIRRLYEAQAEGKISEEERDSLMQKYKDDLARIKEEISRGESIVALGELERMQEEFVKLFSERFEELNRRIKELKAFSRFEPLQPEKPPAEERKEEEAVPTARREREVSKQRAPPSKPEKTEPKKPEPEKSEAEKKIEQIMTEVEKVLERLGQMEAEE